MFSKCFLFLTIPRLANRNRLIETTESTCPNRYSCCIRCAEADVSAFEGIAHCWRDLFTATILPRHLRTWTSFLDLNFRPLRDRNHQHLFVGSVFVVVQRKSRWAGKRGYCEILKPDGSQMISIQKAG